MITTVATVSEFVEAMLALNIASILEEGSPVQAAIIITVFADEHERLKGGAAIGGVSPLTLRKLAEKMREVADDIDAGKHDAMKLNARGGAA